MIKHYQSLTQDQWIALGVQRGFCSETYCAAHDGPPYDAADEEAWDSGDDPCYYTVRLKS